MDASKRFTVPQRVKIAEAYFGDQLISRRTYFTWPPYSLDLNSCDYFLWGYLKERIYQNNPQTLPDPGQHHKGDQEDTS